MSTKPGDWWDTPLNIVTGCEPVSEGCEHCWARAMNDRFKKKKDFSELSVHLDRLNAVKPGGKPKRYFVCNTSDIFHKNVPPLFFKLLYDKARDCPRHTFVLVTKRPERWTNDHSDNVYFMKGDYDNGVYDFSYNWPDNLWFLATIENQARLEERLPHVINVPARIKGLHMEPLLGPVDITPALKHIQWVVVGSEQGPGKRLPPEGAIEGIVAQCKAAGVPVWVKQTPLGKDINLWPENLRLRELPNVV